MVEKYSDEWFRQYALDELHGKHSHKIIRNYVRCKFCCFCSENVDYYSIYTSVIRGGEYVCNKGHGRNDNIADNHLTNHMISARRICQDFKERKI